MSTPLTSRHGANAETNLRPPPHSLMETKPDWRWQLTPSGRFAHRKEYVEQIAEAYRLELMHYESLDGFRHEMGKAVRGHIFVMKKKGPITDEL